MDYRSVGQALWLVEAPDGSKAAAQASSDRIRPAAAELAQVTTKSQSAADAAAATAQLGPFTPQKESNHKNTRRASLHKNAKP